MPSYDGWQDEKMWFKFSHYVSLFGAMRVLDVSGEHGQHGMH